MNKFRNKSVEVDGMKFASTGEARRYLDLLTMQKAGEISDLRTQVEFELIPSFECQGKRYRAMKYIADFTYYKDGRMRVEDFKGMRTPEYMLKRKLFAYMRGMRIYEVTTPCQEIPERW